MQNHNPLRKKILDKMLDDKNICPAYLFKSQPSDLTHFLAIESPLKMMKNAFCFMLKTLFVLEIFTFLS